MCQYPIVLYYIVEAQKRYFGACRLSLHNPAPSQRTKVLIVQQLDSALLLRIPFIHNSSQLSAISQAAR